jgi:hypothetical protein
MTRASRESRAGPVGLYHDTRERLQRSFDSRMARPEVQLPQHAQWSASLRTESAFPGGAGSIRGLVSLGERWALTLRGGGRTAGDVRIGDDRVLGGRLDNTLHRNASGAVGLGYAGSRVSGGVSLQGYAEEHGLPLPPEDDRSVLSGRKVSGPGRAWRSAQVDRQTATRGEHRGWWFPLQRTFPLLRQRKLAVVVAVISVRVVQVAIHHVVGVAVVLYRRVAAVRSMLMGVVLVRISVM